MTKLVNSMGIIGALVMALILVSGLLIIWICDRKDRKKWEKRMRDYPSPTKKYPAEVENKLKLDLTEDFYN